MSDDNKKRGRKPKLIECVAAIEYWKSHPGTHLSDAADKFGVCRATLYKFAHQTGVDVPKARTKAKLSEDQVREIRTKYGTGGDNTLRKLGKEYGVSRTSVMNAVKGTCWSEIE